MGSWAAYVVHCRTWKHLNLKPMQTNPKSQRVRVCVWCFSRQDELEASFPWIKDCEVKPSICERHQREALELGNIVRSIIGPLKIESVQ